MRSSAVAACCLAGHLVLQSVSASGPVPPVDTGYGAEGPYGWTVDSVPEVPFRHKQVHVYWPDSGTGPWPVAFVFPAYSSDTPDPYIHLIRHLASRGACVVFAPYRLAQFPYQYRTYRRMFNGALAGLARLEGRADTARVAFVGHSFGGSAVPQFAWECLGQRGWGAHGACMFIMAPFYMFQIRAQRLGRFPSQTKLIVQVYEDDDCNDHRMAKDLFGTIDIHPDEKDFVLLRSDEYARTGYRLVADHATPFGGLDSEGEVDGLDYYGLFRPLDALLEYAFTGSADAKLVALGNGDPVQRYMGTFPDGSPVRPSIVSDNAPLVRPQSFYYFRWQHPWNLRRRRDRVKLSDPWER